MNDQRILENIANGNEKTLDYLYKKYYRMMVKMVNENNGTENEAKDIYQDALIIFWQKAASKQLVLTSKISTYLYSICQNLWRKELEKKKKLSFQIVEKADNTNYEENERRNIITQCIESLGEKCKKILTLYYFDGLSLAAITKKMKWANTNTTKTKKYKCKKKLDSIIKEKYTTSDFFDL